MNLLTCFKVVSLNISTEFLTEIILVQNIAQGHGNGTGNGYCPRHLYICSKGQSNFVSRYHIINPDVIKIDHVRYNC